MFYRLLYLSIGPICQDILTVAQKGCFEFDKWMLLYFNMTGLQKNKKDPY
jgi:hypothetical protein